MRKILTVVCLAILAAISARGVVLYIPGLSSLYHAAVGAIGIPSAAKALFWFAACAASGALAVDGIMRWRARQVLEVPGRDGGKTYLHQSIIAKIIDESLSQLPEVGKIGVVSTCRAKGLDIDISICARSLRSLDELDKAIRKLAVEGLKRSGIEEIANINIHLNGMTRGEMAEPGDRPSSVSPTPPARSALVQASPESALDSAAKPGDANKEV